MEPVNSNPSTTELESRRTTFLLRHLNTLNRLDYPNIMHPEVCQCLRNHIRDDLAIFAAAHAPYSPEAGDGFVGLPGILSEAGTTDRTTPVELFRAAFATAR